MDRKQRHRIETTGAGSFRKQLTQRAIRIVVDFNIGQLHRIAEMQPMIIAQHDFFDRGLVTLIDKQRLAGLAAQRGQIKFISNRPLTVDAAPHQHMLPDAGLVRQTWRIRFTHKLQCTALPM